MNLLKQAVIITIFLFLLPGITIAQSAVNLTAAGETIVINEVDMSIPDAIELYNAGPAAVDMNGWILRTGDNSNVQSFTLPSVVIQPGGYLVCYEGSGIAANSIIYLGTSNIGVTNINWSGTTQGAVGLLNASGQLDDFVIWGGFTGMTTDFQNWSGPEIDVPSNSSNIGRDINSADSNHSADFFRQIGSLGRANDSPPIFLNALLSPGFINTAYTDSFDVVSPAKPLTYEITAGSLPSGLVLNPDGRIMGSPTESGLFSFYIRVTDSQSPPQSAFELYELSVLTQLFQKEILLVNGVDWNEYGSSIRNAYNAKAFWGVYNIDFWDCFDYTPSGGYPSTLPAPIGNGAVPMYILTEYKTVIWIGNNYVGDLAPWLNTPILDYLKMGGNLLLLSRHGEDFLYKELREYVGISWAERETTINNFITDYSGLQSMTLTGTQNLIDVFYTGLADNESVLLFKETVSFPRERGLGVWKKPSAGGTYDSTGGQVVYLAIRPYRVNSAQLRINVEYILNDIMRVVSVKDNLTNPSEFALKQNYPNPFNHGTTIIFNLTRPSDIKIEIYSLTGQKVRTLINAKKNAGEHNIIWNARNDAGNILPSGIYFARIFAGEFSSALKMTMIR